MAKVQTKFDRCAYCDALLEGDDASLHDPYCPHRKTLLKLVSAEKIARDLKEQSLERGRIIAEQQSRLGAVAKQAEEWARDSSKYSLDTMLCGNRLLVLLDATNEGNDTGPVYKCPYCNVRYRGTHECTQDPAVEGRGQAAIDKQVAAQRKWAQERMDDISAAVYSGDVQEHGHLAHVATEYLGDYRLCSDCPPADYPTDDTRCEPCPRRSSPAVERRGPWKCEACGWEGYGDDGCGTHACNPRPSLTALRDRASEGQCSCDAYIAYGECGHIVVAARDLDRQGKANG